MYIVDKISKIKTEADYGPWLINSVDNELSSHLFSTVQVKCVGPENIESMCKSGAQGGYHLFEWEFCFRH